MEKSRDAFRTISEVADLLGTPAHVLRFWESRFPQIRPVKRAGGRRYYRPSDVALLSGIKRLLHGDGLTIRGVQKVLRENGIRHVMALAEGPIAGDVPEVTSTGDKTLPVAEVLAFPDPAARRDPPETASLPLWSASPSAGQDPARTDPADPAPDSGGALLLTRALTAGPVAPLVTDPDHRPAAKAAAPLPAAAAPADVESLSGDPGLAGVIAARLRALDGAQVQGHRAGMAAAALRLRALRARLAAAAGVGGP
jgi:DNA-binding transcriptional MerR regulator